MSFKRHCLHSVQKVSNNIVLKEKHSVHFLCLKEKFVLCKDKYYVYDIMYMYMILWETFFGVVFYIFDKWRKRVKFL